MNIKSATHTANFTSYEVFHLLPVGDYRGTLSSNTITLDKDENSEPADCSPYVLVTGTFALECDVAIRGTARVILRVTPVFLIVLDENGNQL